MKIGIVDDYMPALQRRLLGEGHELVVFVEGFRGGKTSVVGEEGLICEPPPGFHEGQMLLTGSYEAFISSGVDFFIAAKTDIGGNLYEKLKRVAPTVGWSEETVNLENDRSGARELIQFIDTPLENVPYVEASSAEELCDLIWEAGFNETGCVLKSGHYTDSATVDDTMHVMRTVLVKPNSSSLVSKEKMLELIEGNDAWFNGSCSSVIAEAFIDGHEVCFGAWFNGDKFLDHSIYMCTEYKDAQMDDRSGVLTGEVASAVLTLNKVRASSTLMRAFKSLEGVLRHRGMHGLFDFNLMVRVNPHRSEEPVTLYLLEFTTRFGRPSIEFILNNLRSNVDFGRFLYDIARGATDADTLYEEGDCSYGSVSANAVIFPYGYPLIDFDDHPFANRWSFSIPTLDSSIGTCVIPMMAAYNYRSGKYEMEVADRMAIATASCSVPEFLEDPITTSSRMNDTNDWTLRSLKIAGATWRSDVCGTKFASLIEIARQHIF